MSRGHKTLQTMYLPDQRAIVTHGKEILFTITTESINQMLQIQHRPDETPLHIEILTQLYLNLDFPKRVQIFQTFIPSSVETPKTNPTYPTAIFSERTKHIISMLYLLWVI